MAEETLTITSEMGEEAVSSEMVEAEAVEEGAESESTYANTELEAMREALRKANKQAAANRAKVKELSEAQETAARTAAEEQGEFKKLYEAEQRRAAQALEEANALKAEMVAQRTRSALIEAAQALGFTDPGDAVSFIAPGDIEYDDEGAPTNATDLAKVLAEGKPYLLARKTVPNINAQSGTGNAPAPGEMSEAEIAETAAKFGLTIDNVKQALGVTI